MDIILALLITAIITGALAALYRTIDADRSPRPPRSHAADVFESRWGLPR